MGNLFIYCYFGKISTDSFANMSDFVYLKMEWHILPSKLQKYVVLMIGNMSRPLFYHGFQVAVVDLSTFIRVSITIQSPRYLTGERVSFLFESNFPVVQNSFYILHDVQDLRIRINRKHFTQIRCKNFSLSNERSFKKMKDFFSSTSCGCLSVVVNRDV